MEDAKELIEKLDIQKVLAAFSITSAEFFDITNEIGIIHPILRELKIQQELKRIQYQGSREEWRIKMWADKLDEAFLKRKKDLDKISFWQYATKDKNKCMNYYFQLCNNETSFTELQRQKKAVSLKIDHKKGDLPENLASILMSAKPLVPIKPMRYRSYHFIYQVERKSPAKLDKEMKIQLLQELENEWCDRELQTLFEN